MNIPRNKKNTVALLGWPYYYSDQLLFSLVYFPLNIFHEKTFVISRSSSETNIIEVVEKGEPFFWPNQDYN
ncbi:hypothetical protein [Paraliobacillus sp. JSM ZJ581]|uniref:hypothetical protein n=1 Tax=Paraliobacillus sp. JSM ZJ581 TaxID=3342118 RepID=UPI0035A88642